MNLDTNPTPEQLRELLAGCDDRAGNHLLWVAKSGEVEITRLSRDPGISAFQRVQPEMQFRYTPFQAGKEYVGEDAAADTEWVQELFESLLREWQSNKGKAEVACAGNLW